MMTAHHTPDCNHYILTSVALVSAHCALCKKGSSRWQPTDRNNNNINICRRRSDTNNWEGRCFFSTAWRTSSGAKWPWLPESHSLAAANIRFLTVVLLLRCLVLVHLLAAKMKLRMVAPSQYWSSNQDVEDTVLRGVSVLFTDWCNWWSLANRSPTNFVREARLLCIMPDLFAIAGRAMMFTHARKSPRSSYWIETTPINSCMLQIILDWYNRQYFEHWHNECSEHLFDVTYDTRVMECPNFGSKVCTSSKLNIKNTAKSMQLLLRGSVSLPIRSDVALLKKLQSSSRRMQGSRLSL